ncbi:hypothetical protein L208DRAFT_1375366 [Tricholoma matsutake]|nr:hypothetical protein L208DRAFT_1375366 [Tricholoma matsutake 945]
MIVQRRPAFVWLSSNGLSYYKTLSHTSKPWRSTASSARRAYRFRKPRLGYAGPWPDGSWWGAASVHRIVMMSSGFTKVATYSISASPILAYSRPRTVKKCRMELGLMGSRKTMKILDPKEAEQLVLDEMDNDATRHQGPRTIRHKIAMRMGQHLPCDYIADTMHTHDAAGFIKRDPTAKRIHREPKVPLGINEWWSADGHDKLNGIGFPVWAIVDDAVGRWLGIWVVPSNHLGHIIAYLYLQAVENVGDCGSEMTQLHAIAKALRWLHLHLEFGNSTVIVFKKAEEDGVYLSHIPEHVQLCQWLWPKLLQKLAKEFMESRNAYKSRCDCTKPGPSGMSHNEAYSLPHKWGGWQCLLNVDLDVIHEIKEFISNGEDMFHFPLVTVEFERQAEELKSQSRPQCAGCGLMANRLSGSCNGCIAFYRSATVIPREFVGNLRILELISHNSSTGSDTLSVVESLSPVTNSILANAVTHQENASESRIGVQVCKGAAKSDGAGLPCFKGLSKMVGSGAVNQIQFSRVYDSSMPMRKVLENLLEHLNANFKNLFQVEFDILWSQIKLFTHESATIAASIEYLRSPEAISSGTAGSWLKEFRTQRLCSKASLEAGILNIYGKSAKPSTSLFSKRKCADSASDLGSKHPNARASAQAQNILQDAGHTFLQPGLPASVTQAAAASLIHLSLPQVNSARNSGARTLKSAFHPPPAFQWSRDVPVADYRFMRSTVQYQLNGEVKIMQVSENLEVIAIAEDWLKGEEMWEKKEQHYKTGFISQGFTKCGIYARYNNKEYVITQPFDEYMSLSDVRAVLMTELKLLAQCDGIKEKFDEFIKEDDVKGVPAFYFNFKDAFFGEIEPLSASGRRSLPHIGFLATPLLLCGCFDDPVKKFTGSDNLGPAKDSMTQAVHAFVHFGWIYS